MKKINLKDLSKDEILTRDELKRIVGGNASNDDGSTSQCTTSCSCPRGYQLKSGYGSGSTYSVTVTCESGCVALEESGVSCITPSNLSLTCSSLFDEACEKIPIHS